MGTLETVAICVGCIYFFSLLIIALKTEKPGRTIWTGALAGVAALAAVDLTTVLTGVYIPLNIWTVGGSVASGIPGVVAFLVLKMIMV